MIIYESTKVEFLADVFTDNLVEHISTHFAEKIGKVNEREVRAWDNSMQYMYRVLSDHEIPNNAGVAIEFKVPYTSKRIDFLISGRNDQSDSVVVVELKQWDAVEKVDGKEAIVKTFINKGLIETPHPSYQVWSYAALIEDYNENVQNNKIQLRPCAYLHNYLMAKKDEPLTDPIYEFYVEQAPIFAKGDAPKLREFIKKYIKYGDDKENLYQIENGRIRPSKSLQDSLSGMLKGNKEFTMIDDQKVVYESALDIARESYRSGQKKVLIVEGGPGTGKSVLAINLLVQLTQYGHAVQYVTRNSAPRNIYSAKLKGDFRKTRIDNLFKGSGSFVEATENEFDTLIVDEAHRLNEKSGLFHNLGENQAKEIIRGSRFSIFFIDERQRVTLKDIGSVGLIEQYAEELGAELMKTKLSSQFRCDGSDGYIAWLDDVLQIRETANEHYLGVDYDVQIFSDPHEMRARIEQLNEQKNKSRIVAGYCWDWNSKMRSDPTYSDITIPSYDFNMSWNLDNTGTWAIDEKSVHEAGCIHTCQGLEFDYVGVIIGDDLTYRDGQVVTDYTKRARTDQSLKGIARMMKEDADKARKLADDIIRNTYRTLMTRGQKGCYIFCTDKALEEYLRSRIDRVREV
ncbi:DEAD-like helicase domain fused to uncharacterized conserved domain [Paenibacillus curdlanolyticus YK9]|uniref:DEAD-like helicase domain fused to uncharacterized conserved domain n=1 Tax=Paenibacillus curdlanolyticus YK9 TaxID=717606 RepID=E0IAD4_9BACL|nr:DUF2075 domain-containing protein [Paenibacillus curdlanolyticus]EFM10711.1 DEAD-like helicase domain fused to uncharacterized conserved domain [Paenibacillus curdlanolyticus YK9]